MISRKCPRSHVRFRLLSVALLAGVLAAGSLGVQAEEEEKSERSFAKALKKGDYGITLRYRYENVSDDFFEKDGRASTLRTTAFYRSARFHGLGFFLEFEDVSDLGLSNEHNNLGAGDSWNGVLDRPVILDPPGTEINQVYAAYNGLPETEFLVGRQEINLGDQRYVGAVAWRQNHQSFDAVRIDQKSIPHTRLTYAYVDNASRINGANQGMGTNLFDAEVTVGGAGRLTPYYYSIDFDSPTVLTPSTATYGLRWQGEWKPGGSWSFPYHVELAQQDDTGDNPTTIDADYLRLELSGKRKMLSIFAGYEVLGGSLDDGRFTTPLATLHKFNGWADRFVVTPPNGLEDLYLGAGGNWEGVSLKLIYHDFGSDSLGLDYGSEFDFLATYKTSWKQTFAFKAALYDADAWAADTNIFWVWTAYSF